MSAEAQPSATDASVPAPDASVERSPRSLPEPGRTEDAAPRHGSPGRASLPSPASAASSPPFDASGGAALLALVTHRSTFAPSDLVEDTRKEMQRLHASFAAVVENGEVVEEADPA